VSKKRQTVQPDAKSRTTLTALCPALYTFVLPRHRLSAHRAKDSYLFPMLALMADIVLRAFDLVLGPALFLVGNMSEPTESEKGSRTWHLEKSCSWMIPRPSCRWNR